jgi:hypothetical protein
LSLVRPDNNNNNIPDSLFFVVHPAMYRTLKC